MRERQSSAIRDLRVAVDCLPRQTRVAMLEGIRTNEIIVGAYSDDSGICPMLAAHRAGGRTNFITFARAWDRFAFRGKRGRRGSNPRRASERELLVLRSHLEASLLEDEVSRSDLAEAMSEHHALRARRVQQRPGDPDRSKELRRRPGWAWLRVMRRYDEYQAALAQLNDGAQAQADERQHELIAQDS